MRIFREIEVWGTVVLIDVAAESFAESQLQEGIEELERFMHRVDQLFSTYKESSQVSRIRRGELAIENADHDVQEVWSLSLHLRNLTHGAFDPWKVEGGFDPSGIVKGWAADRSADLLRARGITHILINAAGDITIRGGELKDGHVTPWIISVTDPENHENVVTQYEMMNGAIATSGDYIKGAHIRDPHTGLIAIGARSVTITGPNGAFTDALATAVMVSGIDGAPWFDQLELSEYEVFAINRNQRTSWRYRANS